MMTGKQALELRMKLQKNQSAFWSPIGIGQSGGSRYETGATRIPKTVELLLTIAYGSEAQSKRAVEKLRK